MKDWSARITPEISEYLEATFRPEDPILQEIRERSAAEGLPQIQVGPMDGLHLEVLTRAIGAHRAVEIGTLAGYSGVRIARGLSPEGVLYTFDADARHMKVAEESFRKARVSEKVRTFVGPAIRNLPKITEQGPFDLVFIDADKEGYPDYLAWAAENLRIGGLVIGDNTLAFGMIADRSFDDAEDEATVRALRRFNETAAGSPHGSRFQGTLLPTGEGLTLAVKIR